MSVPESPPCVVNMRFHLDVPWRKSTHRFHGEPEDESSGSETDYDPRVEMFSWRDDTDDDYDVR